MKAKIREKPPIQGQEVYHIECEHDPTTTLNLMGQLGYKVITAIVDPNTNYINWTMERVIYL